MNTHITDALQPFVDKRELAGAVTLVADKDQTLTLDAVGYADITLHEPMRPDTLFWIASMTKPFTGTACLMLVDEGKLDLDAPVAQFLPAFAHPDAQVITVRDTLRHTSGLPFASPEESPTLDALPLTDAVDTYARLPLQSTPGTQYAYSNAGINTAARVLEVVSGMPYETFLQTRLLDPLGLTDTTFVPSDAQAQRLAKAYQPNAEGTGLEETPISQLQYPLTDAARRFPMPAGGLFSTAWDVGRFCRMVLNGGSLDGTRFLSENAVAEMTRKQTADTIPTGYGLGWAVTEEGAFGHAGALSTNMTIDPAQSLLFVYLIQHNGFPGDGGRAWDAFLAAARAQFGTRD